MAAKTVITAAYVRSRFNYNPETGIFTRAAPSHKGRWKVGETVGCSRPDGHIVICLRGRLYRANRLAYLYMTGEWPPHEVDHRNRDKSDNRWGNLRPATPSQNKWNGTGRRNRSSQFRGVYHDKQRGKWRASISAYRKTVALGRFNTEIEAARAYDEAARAMHGEFATLNFA